MKTITIFDRYFIRLWFKNLLIIILLSSSIAFLVDFVELSKPKDMNLINAMRLAILKNYHATQAISVFIILLTTSITYYSLSYKRELMAIFSLGRSHIYLIKPSIICVILYHVIGSVVLNPIDSLLLSKYQELERSLAVQNQSIDNIKNENSIHLSDSGLWFKQSITKEHLLARNLIDCNNIILQSNTDKFNTDNTEYNIDKSSNKEAIRSNNADYEKANFIINIKKISLNTQEIQNIKIFSVNENGQFLCKVFAVQALWENGVWIAKDYYTISDSGKAMSLHNGNLPITFSFQNITTSLVKPEILGIWQVPSFIEKAEEMGLLLLPYQIYLAKSILIVFFYFAIVIMLYIYITYIPRISKPRIISCLITGFFLYFVVEMIILIGSNQGITPLLLCGLMYITSLVLSIFALYKVYYEKLYKI